VELQETRGLRLPVAREGDQAVLTLQEMKIAGGRGRAGAGGSRRGKKPQKVQIDPASFKASRRPGRNEPRYQPPGRCVGPAELKSYRFWSRGHQGARDGFRGRFDERDKECGPRRRVGQTGGPWRWIRFFRRGSKPSFRSWKPAGSVKVRPCPWRSIRAGSGDSGTPMWFATGKLKHGLFPVYTRVTQPRLLKERTVQSFGRNRFEDFRPSGDERVGTLFQLRLCNQCDNCFIYCPTLR